jgi:DNA-binding MarR family transcriptional regulator
MDGYSTINQVLVKLFQDIMNIEEKAIITEEFKDITNNDMHVIEAIGIEEPRNMSTIAKALSVTVGTLTISVNNLVKKGYVNRRRSDQDRRVVLISLSDKGRAAYAHHQEFHDKMVQAILADLNGDQRAALVRALNNLLEFFQSYGRENYSGSEQM